MRRINLLTRRNQRFGGLLPPGPVATVTSVNPPTIAGELLSLRAAAGTTADQSGNGNSVVETGGAPTFAASARFAGFTTMNFTTGKCLVTTGACNDYRIGADKAWTQVLIFRPTGVGAAQNLAGWSRTDGASDLVHAVYAEVSGSKHYRDILRDDAAAATTVDCTAQWDAAPELLIVVCSGTAITYYVNGVASGASLAQDKGVFTPTAYNVMCRNAQSGLGATGNGDLLEHYVYNFAMTSASDRNLWAQYAYDKYGMGASGATGPAQKVGILIAQSNGRLAGTTTLTNGSKVRAFTLDNFWRQNPTYSQSDAAAVYTSIFAEGLGSSVNWGLFACDAMAGSTGNSYGLITNAKGSTGTGGAAGPASATNWFPSTSTATLYGAAMATVGRATLISGATPLFAMIDIGEEDSKPASSTWAAGFANIKADLRARWPGIIICIRQLRATNPNPGTYLDWAGTVSAEAAEHNPGDGVYVFASSDNGADYSDGVHMTAAAQLAFGQTVATTLGPLI